MIEFCEKKEAIIRIIISSWLARDWSTADQCWLGFDLSVLIAFVLWGQWEHHTSVMTSIARQWLKPMRHTLSHTHTYHLLPIVFLCHSPLSPLNFPPRHLTLYSVSVTTRQRRRLMRAVCLVRWAGLGEISAVRADGGEVRAAPGHPERAAVRRAAVSRWQRAPPSGRAGERGAAAGGQCHSAVRSLN